jgi:hypothetical protein
MSPDTIWLDATDSCVATARSVTLGEASKCLPIVYVSAIGPNRWLLSKTEIEELAYELGGVAHLVVEPDRDFSFRLRDKTLGRNAYGGNIGLVLPERGMLRSFYLGWQLPRSNDLVEAVRAAVLHLRLQMPAIGWEWTELQEHALRVQRERDRNQLSTQESEELYLQEIDNLQDQIEQMKRESASLPVTTLVGGDNEDLSADNLVRLLGPEVYPGEHSDRLRLAASIAISAADQVGLDRRSRVIFDKLKKGLPASPALNELLEDLERATKNPKRVANEVVSLLRRHGYREKSDNKHIRLEAINGYDGLEAITLPKTPSDGRGLKNLRKQIERTLGVTKLSDT